MKKSKKIFYRKLVRDTIPEIIAKSGAEYSVRTLRAREFDVELLKKLSEEADEVKSAKTRKEIISELGDVLDVIDEIRRRKKISDTEIATARKASLDRKGGFTKRLFLEWSADTGYVKKNNHRKGE